MQLIFFLLLWIHGSLSIDLIDISIDGYSNRFFPNVSYGLSDLPDHQRQCNTLTGEMKGTVNIESGGKHLKNRMKFTPNRRPQSSTVLDGENNRLQVAFVLAVGGHSDSHYNYGPGGSINGLMAVWDSWAENFFRYTSNTTSLVLLFDQRDFLRQNHTTSKKDYLDNILINNMGAAPVDCVTKRVLNSYSLENITESMFYHQAHTGKAHAGNYYTPGNSGSGGGNRNPTTDNSPNSHPHGHAHGNHRAGKHPGPGHRRLNKRPASASASPGGNTPFDGHAPLGCKNTLSLDQSYFVYYFDYAPASAPAGGPDKDAGDAAAEAVPHQPLIIFASVYEFPKPDWAAGPKAPPEDKLFDTWRPHRLNKRYPTNYGYVKMTNWYAYHSLNLQLLEYFDYAGKLDNDVSFAAPFPAPNLAARLARGGHFMLTSAAGWYHDDPRISQGVELCIYKYLEQESRFCSEALHALLAAPRRPAANASLAAYLQAVDRQTVLQQDSSKQPYLLELLPGGDNDTTFFETNFNTTFRAHFLVYWLGLYTSPEVKHFAKYWNDFHPYGMWDFRWGDQQWWPRPIALYGSGNLAQEIDHYDEINTDNGKFVVHKEWPRWGTIPKVNYYSVNGTTKKQRQEMYAQAAKKFIY